MDRITEADIKTATQTFVNNTSLDVIPAGSVPNNPTDLMACGKLNELINILKDIYDYIIIDATSLDNNADALYINKVANYTLYVIRADKTTRKSVEAIDQLVESEKLKNVNVAVNAIDMTQKKYKYQYGK